MITLLQGNVSEVRISHVIRIDAAVFEELQKRARPFIDTPNDVLRRLLKLNAKEKPMTTAQRRSRSDSGRRINRRYKLGAAHALYHVDGSFYEKLERFPGFLSDASGYVWYETERDFENDPHVDIQEKVHVPSALARHPRYQRFPE
jgi:5-methylcytosine-specific restriction protein A